MSRKIKLPYKLFGLTAIVLTIAGITASLVLVSQRQNLEPQAVGRQELINLLEDVSSLPAEQVRYHALDDRNRGMETVKIIPNPQGGYLGVYHYPINPHLYVAALGRSNNLLDWANVYDFEESSSQPTIAQLSNGGYLVVYEKDANNPETERWLRFRYYQDLSALLTNNHKKEFNAPRTLGQYEGTPNIYSVGLNPDIDNSQIEVGFHYYDGNDWLAHGTLTNFNSWSARRENGWKEALNNLGARGQHGDRDSFIFNGKRYNLQEANNAFLDHPSWSPYLYSFETNTFEKLNIRTHQGSLSLANPTFTELTLPNGKLGFVATYYLFVEGNPQPGEAGELIYWREYPSPSPSPSPLIACPGGTDACGDYNYGRLAECSGSWTYSSNNQYDRWCLATAGNLDEYCYRCDLLPSPSPSPSPRPSESPSPSPVAKLGDINGDGQVSMLDVGIIIEFFDSSPPGDPRADLNGDGRVSMLDLGIVIENFNR